jgi:hypothetical protein
MKCYRSLTLRSPPTTSASVVTRIAVSQNSADVPSATTNVDASNGVGIVATYGGKRRRTNCARGCCRGVVGWWFWVEGEGTHSVHDATGNAERRINMNTTNEANCATQMSDIRAFRVRRNAKQRRRPQQQPLAQRQAHTTQHTQTHAHRYAA